MKQYEQVIKQLEENDGFATLGYLYRNVDVSNWGTKTPFASIRRIVQKRDEIFRIKPGLWALKKYKKLLPEEINPSISTSTQKKKEYSHSYFQGLLVEIGNMKSMETYIPPQDKNKKFLKQKLIDVTTIKKIYKFSYDELVRFAKNVDVVWFNERKMPYSFFEVEFSTDFKNSLIKFVQLQDFYTKFYIISDEAKKNRFSDLIKLRSFKDIKKRVKYLSYTELSDLHSHTSKSIRLKKISGL